MIDQPFAEHMLPSGRSQLIFALHEGTFTYTANSLQPVSWSRSLVHGPQWGHYVAGPKSAGVVAGVSFRPGFAGAILGVPSSELADRHVSLASLWGRRAEQLRERLLENPEPPAVFHLLEQHLRAKIERPLLMHPAIASTLSEVWVPDRISLMQRATGFSPKHFIALFRTAVGLTPKHFFRIQRFNEVARTLAAPGHHSLAELAAELGYADQAHLTREFRELAGVTPSRYRGRTDSPFHHPEKSPDRPSAS